MAKQTEVDNSLFLESKYIQIAVKTNNEYEYLKTTRDIYRFTHNSLKNEIDIAEANGEIDIAKTKEEDLA